MVSTMFEYLAAGKLYAASRLIEVSDQFPVRLLSFYQPYLRGLYFF